MLSPQKGIGLLRKSLSESEEDLQMMCDTNLDSVFI